MSEILRPRPAINVYGAGGLMFVALGIVEAVTVVFLPEIVRWIWYHAFSFIAIGTLWVVLTARMGKLGEPRHLLETGQQAAARIVDVRWSGAQARSYGAVTRRLCRLELEIHCPGQPPYGIRVFRNLPAALRRHDLRGLAFDARIDPARPRQIALNWDAVIEASCS